MGSLSHTHFHVLRMVIESLAIKSGTRWDERVINSCSGQAYEYTRDLLKGELRPVTAVPRSLLGPSPHSSYIFTILGETEEESLVLMWSFARRGLPSSRPVNS